MDWNKGSRRERPWSTTSEAKKDKPEGKGHDEKPRRGGWAFFAVWGRRKERRPSTRMERIGKCAPRSAMRKKGEGFQTGEAVRGRDGAVLP